MSMKRFTNHGRLVVAGLLWLASHAASLGAEKWSVDDLMSFEHVADLAVSPADPRVVVWVKSALDKEKNELVSHLCRSGPALGTEAVQLTRGRYSCLHPRFSPDGRGIAFLSPRPLPQAKGKDNSGDNEDKPKAQIWLLERGEPYPLIELDREVKDFAWRDTNRIVFIAPESPAERELELKEKKDTSAVVEDAANEAPVRLFEVELKAKKITRMSTNADWITALFVSPDGQLAVTFHNQSLRYEYDQAIRPQSFLTDLRTGERRRVFSERRLNLQTIEWLLDSRGLYAASAFTMHPKYLNATISELWRFELDGAKETRVPLDWDRGLCTEVSWYAGGGYLATTPDGFVALLADGARVKAARFTLTGGAWQRAWLEGDYSANFFAVKFTELGPTNRLHFIHTTGEVPPQLFAAELDGAKVVAPAARTALNDET